MANIHSSMTDLIDRTPLVEISRLSARLCLKTRLLVKVEFLNPTGSVKDRAALGMLNDAEEKGILHPGGTIIEPTSGNTGIGLAAIAAVRGYRVILTMPETMSAERRNILRAYGAELVLTSGSRGMAGAVEKAAELARSIPNSFLPDQFSNRANAEAHYRTTGPELWRDTEGKLDLFVAGVGTGGTLTGTARYLKEQNSAVRVVAVEPASSPLLSEGRAGSHGLQGIGANFVPDLLDRDLIDEILPVTEAQAFAAARLLAKREGLLAGISAGAALHAAIALSKRPEHAGKTVAVILPDSGDRYYSSPIFQTEEAQ